MKIKSKLLNWILLVISILYIANIGFGIIELIPDNFPLIGNIDEGTAGALVLVTLKNLGFIK